MDVADLGAPTRTPRQAVRLLDIREAALDVTEVLAAVEDPAAGGVALFVGAVRDHDSDRGVTSLDYSAHPTAQQRLAEVAERVAARHDVHALAAIHRVATGDAVFSPRLAGFVLDAFAGAIDVAAVDEDLDRLTEREREVMRLIARGYSYKEVASELFISIKTVETHMGSVLRKLQLSSRHELTRWASERRLL